MESTKEKNNTHLSQGHEQWLDQLEFDGKIGGGSFGQVYALRDLQNNLNLVCKINKSPIINDIEADVLKAINQKKYKNFPQLYCICQFEDKPALIMERFGESFSRYTCNYPNGFTFKTTQQFGIKMLHLIEQVHSVGYLHCDLKPDNICVGELDDANSLNEFKLIDFGLSIPYIKNKQSFVEPKTDDDHIEFDDAPQKGNLIFASPNSVLGKTLSRRDDLISLFYLLLYLQTKVIPFFVNNIDKNKNTKRNTQEQKKSIIKEKLRIPYKQLCKDFKSEHMFEFANIIFNLQFKEKPNYSKLRFLLEKNLMDRDMVPNKQYDWNQPHDQINNGILKSNVLDQRKILMHDFDNQIINQNLISDESIDICDSFLIGEDSNQQFIRQRQGKEEAKMCPKIVIESTFHPHHNKHIRNHQVKQIEQINKKEQIAQQISDKIHSAVIPNQDDRVYEIMERYSDLRYHNTVKLQARGNRF